MAKIIDIREVRGCRIKLLAKPQRYTPTPTFSLHFDAVRGLAWIKKRNPKAIMLMSVAQPVNDERLIIGPRHIPVFSDTPLSASEAVDILLKLPEGSSVAWRRL